MVLGECEECGRVFDALSPIDADEFYNGHDCEAVAFEDYDDLRKTLEKAWRALPVDKKVPSTLEDEITRLVEKRDELWGENEALRKANNHYQAVIDSVWSSIPDDVEAEKLDDAIAELKDKLIEVKTDSEFWEFTALNALRQLSAQNKKEKS